MPSGAAPIIAEIARETGALTVGVVTKPFLFEGKVRMRQADEGIQHLKRSVDTLITIPNQRLLNVVGKNTRLRDAFRKADEVLHNAVKGISDTITVSGLINVDFADVRTIMSEMGMALMGEGIAKWENRAVEAAQRAISSPLLEDISIDGARGMLVNVTAGNDLTLHEVHEAITLIQESAHPEANVIFGAVIDEDMEEDIRITVIATGICRVEKAWKHADEGLRDEFLRMQKGFAFYVGDQWDAADLQKLAAEKRPALTINLILPIINLLAGIQRQGRQDMTVVARKGGLKQLASAFTQILRHCMDMTDADYETADCFLDGLIGNKGWLSLFVDFTEDPVYGDLAVRKVSPFEMREDPDAREYDLNSSGKFVIRDILDG